MFTWKWEANGMKEPQGKVCWWFRIIKANCQLQPIGEDIKDLLMTFPNSYYWICWFRCNITVIMVSSKLYTFQLLWNGGYWLSTTCDSYVSCWCTNRYEERWCMILNCSYLHCKRLWWMNVIPLLTWCLGHVCTCLSSVPVPIFFTLISFLEQY